MDLENQKRVKEADEKFGNENLVVLLGAAEAEAAGLAAETVTVGDPTFAGPLAGVELNLAVYHIVEEEIKSQIDEEIYEDQVGMMEMVLQNTCFNAIGVALLIAQGCQTIVQATLG